MKKKVYMCPEIQAVYSQRLMSGDDDSVNGLGGGYSHPTGFTEGGAKQGFMDFDDEDYDEVADELPKYWLSWDD